MIYEPVDNSFEEKFCSIQPFVMLKIFRRKLRWFCSRIWWLTWRRPRPKVVVKRLGKWKSKGRRKQDVSIKSSEFDNHGGQMDNDFASERPIHVATFNVAMFSLAPAVPKSENSSLFAHKEAQFFKSPRSDHPESILKRTTFSSPQKSKAKVSINLPDNEISLANSKLLCFVDDEKDDSESFPAMADQRHLDRKGSARSPVCFPFSMFNWQSEDFFTSSGRSILEVVREINADILALQDVKAEEEKGMKPLSDLAASLGMKYVFAESWAPEYGNAVLSKWPIKRWKIHKIANDDDFRNLLKVTIEVPRIGEINICCTQLDHLDENWRMKQINAITQTVDCPHILLGGLNSLEMSDYSYERWRDIVKYYEQIGKPTPKTEVLKFLKGRGYIDSKDFAGDCESVVMIARGQNVQGTCKYGTRVDYILSSSDSPFKFVPKSYSVVSSKGTSDHHVVKADIIRTGRRTRESVGDRQKKFKERIVRVANSCSSNGLWYMQRS